MPEINQAQISKSKNDLQSLRDEVRKIIVGQDKVIDSLIRAMLSNGHVLVEGIPGIAKTLLIRTLSESAGCKFKRIQFTPDLLPSDIIGITSYDKNKGFYVIKGPIFTNFLLADEINRAPPKVQSALLEVMQEKQATIGKETYKVDEPFFVLATQNPIETLGTYPLPEAQIDRFLFKLLMGYPTKEEESRIIEQNISLRSFEEYRLRPILSPEKIIKLQQLAKGIGHSHKIKEYIVELVDATRHSEKYGIKMGKYIEYGASPRAAIGMFIAAKSDALINGDAYIKPQHVKNIAHDVLRHRIILNYVGQAENIKAEEIVTEILSKVPIP